jgi:hypothetical protein
MQSCSMSLNVVDCTNVFSIKWKWSETFYRYIEQRVNTFDKQYTLFTLCNFPSMLFWFACWNHVHVTFRSKSDTTEIMISDEVFTRKDVSWRNKIRSILRNMWPNIIFIISPENYSLTWDFNHNLIITYTCIMNGFE